MYSANLRSVGGSVMIAIPKTLLEVLGLRSNAKVGLSVVRGKLVIEPNPKPRYSLSQLIEQCDASAPVSREDTEWLADPPTGGEAL